MLLRCAQHSCIRTIPTNSSCRAARPVARPPGARAAFAGVPAAVLSDGITPYDLQVHLCEWRKFRTKVDRTRLCRRGVVLDPAVAARAVFRKRRKSPAASSGTAVAPYSV